MERKILQINTVVNTGSTGRIAEEQGEYMITQQWDSYIGYGRGEGISKSKLIPIGNKTDMIMHGIETRLFDRHGLSSKRATKKFVEEIIRIKPDLIHLHNIHGYYLNYAILFDYLHEANVPVVWTLHDCWTMTGHCSHFSYVNCNKWKQKCEICPQKSEYPKSYFMDRSEPNYLLKSRYFSTLKNLHIVSVSNWLNNVVSESFFRNTPHYVIKNGIDLELFKPAQSNLLSSKYKLENRYVILGVSSVWDNRKGLDDFLELSKQIDNDSTLVLVGLTEDQKKNLPPNIVGISRTDNIEELVMLYSEADVFISASVEESFGMVIAEALACGTPVIAYNATASPEMLDESVGILVPPKDMNATIKAIQRIRERGKIYFSAACIKRARELYDKKRVHEQYFSLYNTVLK